MINFLFIILIINWSLIFTDSVVVYYKQELRSSPVDSIILDSGRILNAYSNRNSNCFNLIKTSFKDEFCHPIYLDIHRIYYECYLENTLDIFKQCLCSEFQDGFPGGFEHIKELVDKKWNLLKSHKNDFDKSVTSLQISYKSFKDMVMSDMVKLNDFLKSWDSYMSRSTELIIDNYCRHQTYLSDIKNMNEHISKNVEEYLKLKSLMSEGRGSNQSLRRNG